jgi:hypothetical protein
LKPREAPRTLEEACAPSNGGGVAFAAVDDQTVVNGLACRLA